MKCEPEVLMDDCQPIVHVPGPSKRLRLERVQIDVAELWRCADLELFELRSYSKRFIAYAGICYLNRSLEPSRIV